MVKLDSFGLSEWEKQQALFRLLHMCGTEQPQLAKRGSTPGFDSRFRQSVFNCFCLYDPDILALFLHFEIFFIYVAYLI